MRQAVNDAKVFPSQGVEVSPYASEMEKKSKRFYKEVGYGVKVPESAIGGTYIDMKCPFTGTTNIKGNIRVGVVVKLGSSNTCTIEMNTLRRDKKYKRFRRCRSRVQSHLSPCFKSVEIGDTVKFGETRPLSKTKSSAVIEIVKKGNIN